MRSHLLAAPLLLLAGCGSSATRPAAPTSGSIAGASAGRRVRFEVVETVRIEKVKQLGEVWLPIASNEAGYQEIEKLEVTTRPETRHEFKPDGHGNRLLYVKTRVPVDVKVSYRVLRTEVREDLDMAEKRPLTPAELAAVGEELKATSDPELAPHRRAGRPARRAVGVRVEGFVEDRALPCTWVEVFAPGLAWVPYEKVPDGWQEERSVLPADVLVVARGTRSVLPFATIDGTKAWIYAAFKGKLLDAP